MKFSRNPKTGILEIYTDDGKYVGTMSTMGDAENKEQTVNDAKPDQNGIIEKLNRCKEMLKYVDDPEDRKALEAEINKRIRSLKNKSKA